MSAPAIDAAFECYRIIGDRKWEFESDEDSIQRFRDLIDEEVKASADKARLDWLEANKDDLEIRILSNEGMTYARQGFGMMSPSLRYVIDVAMLAARDRATEVAP